MLGCRSRSPPAAPAIFLKMRFTSLADAVGRRLPIEFTQRMRLSRARIFIACIFDSGSPSQSLEKQTMSRPFRTLMELLLRGLAEGMVSISGARTSGGRAVQESL